jgi:glycosyltransferase involved in cell wall biosynthesis
MRLCAVIPAYNSETTITEVVRKTRARIDRVVVIDDGSTDDTAQLAKSAGADVLSVPKNRGKGNALRLAFCHALKNDLDAIITLDADLQHDPSDIPKFITHYLTRGSRIVIGNRLTDREKIPRIRYTVNRIGTYTFSWLINQHVEDSQCGFRLYDRLVIGNFQILNDGFEAEADLLLRVGKRGYKIGFVPIKTIYSPNPQSRSYYRPVKDTFRISIIFLMNLFWKYR